ncbi:MAG TPA: MFS transporter [Roseiflexaceae bacterium]|nr:MFS transporter [Roseiflexaceae bacterium]
MVGANEIEDPPLLPDERTRQRGLMVMLADTFLMWGGFFMVIPLISVHFVDDRGWDPTAIGLLLGVRQVTQQGLTLVGGALADRLGARGLIAIGMLVRAFSFVLMGFATTYPVLMASVLLAALGGAMFDSPSSAAIAALTREDERSRFYSLLGVVGGLGMTIGPLLGAVLLRLNFSLVAFVAAASFFIAFGVTFFLLPPVRVATGTRGLLEGITMALHDRRFVMFNLLLMGYWFMWVQLTISMPLLARAVSGTNDAVSWIYALNSVMGIVLQYPVLWLAERWLRPSSTLVVGIALMALALGSVAFVHTVAALLLSVSLFALGRLLASPSQQTVAASLANPAARGSYFGVNALALAFGGGFGNAVGGMLYGYALHIHAPQLPWLIFGAVGLLSAVGLALFALREARALASNVTVLP